MCFVVTAVHLVCFDSILREASFNKYRSTDKGALKTVEDRASPLVFGCSSRIIHRIYDCCSHCPIPMQSADRGGT